MTSSTNIKTLRFNGAPDRNPGRGYLSASNDQRAQDVSMEPQIGIRGRHGANRDDVGGRGVSIEPQIGIRGRWASDAESVPALTSQ